ncbi:hypothetical protein [Halosquirtibacter xylanolyticus]
MPRIGRIATDLFVVEAEGGEHHEDAKTRRGETAGGEYREDAKG